MVDWYGTPHSDALHVVQRYRLINRRAAMEAGERAETENGRLFPGNGVVDPDYLGDGLQVLGRGPGRLRYAMVGVHLPHWPLWRPLCGRARYLRGRPHLAGSPGETFGRALHHCAADSPGAPNLPNCEEPVAAYDIAR